MEFLHASIALLASMVLVLAAMVGWLYWQQTRLFQNMNSIVMVIGELVRPTPPPTLEEKEVLEEMAKMNEPVAEAVEQEDDRVSVEAEPKVDVVSGPPEPIDTDELDGKTKKELHEMLTKRGIPFGKNDAKPVLISLLKATA
jgi:hypothetical protein